MHVLNNVCAIVLPCNANLDFNSSGTITSADGIILLSLSSGTSQAYYDRIYNGLTAETNSKMGMNVAPGSTFDPDRTGTVTSFDLTRTGIFDEVRTVDHNKLSVPADKWCPGDVYVVVNEAKARSILQKAQTEDSSQTAGILNNIFVSKWGSVNAPLVAVSLKFEKAQGGKAKAYFDKFKKAKTEYNLTSDEQSFNEKKYREGIERLRKSIISFVSKNKNMKYDLSDSDVKNIKVDQLKGKYAALKSLNFFFTQVASSEGVDLIDDGLLALAAFAMSLGDISPTFFKVIASTSGDKGKIETFEAGSALSLYIEDKIQPIKITDSLTFGGLVIEILASKKKDDNIKITLNARNNGTTQGTIEISKIQHI
jgi:hypothetical protein